MVRNPCRQDWEAPSNLPIGTIDWDAIKRSVLQGCKNEFEYVLQSVGVHLSLVLICFGGLGEFGGAQAIVREAEQPWIQGCYAGLTEDFQA